MIEQLKDTSSLFGDPNQNIFSGGISLDSSLFFDCWCGEVFFVAFWAPLFCWSWAMLWIRGTACEVTQIYFFMHNLFQWLIYEILYVSTPSTATGPTVGTIGTMICLILTPSQQTCLALQQFIPLNVTGVKFHTPKGRWACGIAALHKNSLYSWVIPMLLLMIQKSCTTWDV